MSDIPIIAGATVEVSSGALAFDLQRRLDEADADAVTFDIISPAGVIADADQPMTWDSARRLFVGRWETPSTIPGEYTALITWDALDGATLLAVVLFTVDPNPAEATP